MFTKSRLLVTAILFMLFASSLSFSQLDTCWTMAEVHDPENGSWNPDSIMVDTCEAEPKYYVKKWYEFHTDQIIIDVPAYPRDSIVESQWTDIDTSFSEIRSDLEEMEKTYGSFYFKKAFPDFIDTTKLASRVYYIRFVNYVDQESVESYLKSCSSIHNVWFIWSCGRYPTTVEEQILNNSGLILEQNIPNPFEDETEISFILPEECHVKLTVSNTLGQILSVLADGNMTKGRHTLTFKTDKIQSGVYLYSLEACGKVITKQMQIIK
jgi:hypothetical protein